MKKNTTMLWDVPRFHATPGDCLLSKSCWYSLPSEHNQKA
jgi:hypothetical protein